MGRKILFITTDQQRYDALGCNGGAVARTPVIDGLAERGLNYGRAHVQNVVCMPSRSTMITGQYVRTHGVWMNGVPLPESAPSVFEYLQQQRGYRTALLGKAHFQPVIDPKARWTEGRLAREASNGPYRGFEHVELVMHGPVGPGHYPRWMRENHPEEVGMFYPQILMGDDGLLQVNHAGGGDTGAPQVHRNAVPRDHYHTDWVAERTIAFLDSLSAYEDWFVWMSFPDPHHPWDPPASEAGRHDWRELALPEGYPGSAERAAEILAERPRHWLDWFKGEGPTNFEAPRDFVPARLTPDQIREINALAHVENELIDEACGRVLARIAERGWADETDVLYTSDHGELQGDLGLMFKGPYHVDALMRVPLLWAPARSAGIDPSQISEPVGLLDLAPTFCGIAELPVPEWMEGKPLPVAPGSDRVRVLTEWDSVHRGHELHLQSIYRDGWLCTTYGAGGVYDGSEGELYDLGEDPWQWRNRWDEPGLRSLQKDLCADLHEHLPPARDPQLAVEADV